MKLNRKARRQLLSKLGFDPGTSKIPNIDFEALVNKPLQEGGLEPQALTAPSVAEQVDYATVEYVIDQALDVAVDSYLRSIESNPKAYSNIK